MNEPGLKSLTAAHLIVTILLLGGLSGCGSSPSSSTTPPPSTITVTVSSSTQNVAAAQNATLTATTNDPKGVNWSLSGQGSLSNNTSTSVTYTAPGIVPSAFTATVTATSITQPTVSTKFQINISGESQRLVILSDSLPLGAVSQSYFWPVLVSGGTQPFNYSVSSGSLPPGLALGGSSGMISGTPTTLGTYSFTCEVSDSASPPDVTTQNLSITIVEPGSSLTVSNAPPGNGVVGQGYITNIPVSGGTQPYTFQISSGTLPTGLFLENSSGGGPGPNIQGTPTTTGTYNFTLQVTDSDYPANVGTANLSITIYPSGTFTILTGSLPNGEVGMVYPMPSIGVVNGQQPFTFSVAAGTVPPGLTLNSSGVVSGKPTTAGTYTFTAQVSDFSVPPKVASANFRIVIAPPLGLATSSLPNASVGMVYVAPLQASGGVPPYSISSPTGLGSVNPFDGTISFVPTTVGVQSFQINVSDALGGQASSTLDLTVDAANCPNNANFKGNYAMLFNGAPVNTGNSEASGSFVGSFNADGAGNVSQGYQDNGGSITQTGLHGTYCVGPSNIGTLVYNGVFLMQLDSRGNGDVITYENPLPEDNFASLGFGTITKQDTSAFNTSTFVGQYSLGWSGGFEVEAATFSSDGAGNLSNGELDRNGAGSPSSATFTATDFAVGATAGRGEATLNESGAVTVPMIFYVVNASELFAVATPSSPAGTYVVGPIIQSTGGPYSISSLNGVSVFGIEGEASVAGVPQQSQVGLIAWDGAGDFTLTADQNQGGLLSTVSYSGSYSIDPFGRVTLTSNAQSSPPVFYLTGPNQGFIVTAADIRNGQFFAQTGSSFNNGSFSGSYLGRELNGYVVGGSPAAPAFQTELDNVSADGAGTLSGISYFDDAWYGPSSVAVSSNYTVSSSGRGVVSVDGNQTDIFYVVSPTQVLMTSSSSTYPKVMSLTHP